MRTSLIIGVIIILAVVGAFVFWPRNYYIEHKDLNLSQEERTVYEVRLKQAQDVISKFSKTTSKEDKFTWYVALGMADMGLGDYKDSKAAFEKAFSNSPNDVILASTKIQYANLLIAMENFGGAKDAIWDAINLQPTNPDYWKAYIALESVHFNASDADIRNLYAQAIEKTNSDLYIMIAYAEYLEKTSDNQTALQAWKAVVAKYPTNAQAKAAVTRLEKLISG